MNSNNIHPVIRWWATPKLPREHIFISPEKRPKEIDKIIRVYFRKWVVHPLKRRIVRYYLKFLQQFFGLTVIGITGSAGKTTAKEMAAAILSQKGKTVWTPANLDPIYNIPSTILRCMPTTKYLILEMGVEFPGEMDFYLWLARPRIRAITNIYQTHTQFFGSINGVAEEKEKLAEQSEPDDFVVLNKDNTYLQKIAKKTKAKVIWFDKDSPIRAEKIKITGDFKTQFTLHVAKKNIEITLPLLGSQFVENALAAAAIGFACSATIKEIKTGLENFNVPEHRMRPIKLANGALILDDSYNSNPTAAKTALETLKEVSGKKKMIVVMGDMLELGKDEKERHKELGRQILAMVPKLLIGVGRLSQYLAREAKRKMPEGSVKWAGSQKEVLPILTPALKRDTVTLIKGSRSIGLDKLIEELVKL